MNWFKVTQIHSQLYCIQERLDLIDSSYLTKFTNIYLLIGETHAMIIDTGSGTHSLLDEIYSLIQDKKLIVINTHNHFDHILGNGEFEEINIHRFDFKKLMSPIDISFLQNIEFPRYKKLGLKISSAKVHIPLLGGEEFELGGYKVTVIHTPGHTPGSICLLTDKDELFTGDTVHHGALYLPTKEKIDTYSNSLQILSELCDQKDLLLYPAHEEFPLNANTITKIQEDLTKNYPYPLTWTDNRELPIKSHQYNEHLDGYYYTVSEITYIYPKE